MLSFNPKHRSHNVKSEIPHNRSENVKGLPFLWDNWLIDLGLTEEVRFGRISLEAQRNEDPNSRHSAAQIAFYLRNKDGQYFKFCNVLGDAPSWSGSALNLSKIQQEHVLKNLTGTTLSGPANETLKDASPKDLKLFKDTAMIIPYTSPFVATKPEGYPNLFQPQSISLCFKRAGELDFYKHGMILNPYSLKDENLKYYKIDESAHVISAWRDPFIMFEKGKYHMFFAARYSQQFFDEFSADIKKCHSQHPVYQQKDSQYDDDQNSVIGHAVSDNLINWQLKKPLVLSANASQFELPAVVKVKDSYYLMVVVSDGNVAIDNPQEGQRLFGPRTQYLLGFKTDQDLDHFDQGSAWKPLNNDINQTTHPFKKLYGMTFKPVENNVYMTAFHDGECTMTKIVNLDKSQFPKQIPSEHDPCWQVRESIKPILPPKGTAQLEQNEQRV